MHWHVSRLTAVMMPYGANTRFHRAADMLTIPKIAPPASKSSSRTFSSQDIRDHLTRGGVPHCAAGGDPGRVLGGNRGRAVSGESESLRGSGRLHTMNREVPYARKRGDGSDRWAVGARAGGPRRADRRAT